MSKRRERICADIFGLSRKSHLARLRHANIDVPCALGGAGRQILKFEGDRATPIGVWRMERVFYRADRIRRPASGLATIAIRPDHGWCDAVGDRNYNRFVRLPYDRSAERLWRQDEIYDVIVVLSHNRLPRIQNAGSAIFLHIARPGYRPTHGCVALARDDLLRFLEAIPRAHGLRVRA